MAQPPIIDSDIFNSNFYISRLESALSGGGGLTEIPDPLTVSQIICDDINAVQADITTANITNANVTGDIHLSKHIEFETGLLTGTSVTLTEVDLKRHYASTQTTDVDVYLPEINGDFKQVTLSALNTGKIIVRPCFGTTNRIDDNVNHVNINAGVTKCFQSVSNDTTGMAYNNWEFVSTQVPDDLLVDTITLNKNLFYNANIVNSTPYSTNDHFRYYICESGSNNITLPRLNENQFVRTSIYNKSGINITIFCNANDTILGGSSTLINIGEVLHLEGNRDSSANGSWIDIRPNTSVLTSKGDLLSFDTAETRLAVGSDNQVLVADSAQALGVKWSDVPEKLTTKGDLLSFDTAETRLAVGSDNQVLVADSAQALGVKWSDVPETLTTKGDLLSFDTAENRLAVGTNGQVLVADSAQALGIKWASVPETLTTKGDLLSFDTAENRLAVGTNGQVLVADSTQALGIKWASVPETLTTKGDLLSFGTAETRLGIGTNGQVLVADSTQALGLKWSDTSTGLTSKGDLLSFGTAETRLGIGTNGQVLTADSAQSLGLKWADVALTTLSDTYTTGVTLLGNSTLSALHVNKVTLHDGLGNYELTLTAYSGIVVGRSTFAFCNNSSSSDFKLIPDAGITFINRFQNPNIKVTNGGTAWAKYIQSNTFIIWGDIQETSSPTGLIEPVDRWQVNTVDSRLLGTNDLPVADFADVKRWLSNGDTAMEWKQESGQPMPSYGSSPNFHEVAFNSVATEGLYCLETNWTLSERNGNMTWYFVVYSTNNGQNQVLYSRGSGTSTGQGYLAIWNNRTIYCFSQNSPSPNIGTFTTSTVPDSQYFILTIVLDGSNPNGEYATIYFNGILQPTTGALQGSTLQPHFGSDFALGTYMNGSTPASGASLGLNGTMKDVLIYSGSQHTQEQVTQNVNYLKTLHGIA